MNILNHDIVINEYDEIDSTNLEAKRLIESKQVPSPIFAISAKIQTAGIGRLGRKWLSSDSAGNIFLTLAISENLINEEISQVLSLATGFACAKAIKSKQIGLKWPNDIMIKDSSNYFKVGGILIQKIQNFFIIGIGINTNQTPNVTNAKFEANSLANFGITLTIKDIITELNSTFQMSKTQILKGWKSFAFFLNTKIKVNESEGVFIDIYENTGNIILQSNNNQLIQIETGTIE